MAFTTAWLIGSVKDLDARIKVDGVTKTIAGNYYLTHPRVELSLMVAMTQAMVAVFGISAFITQGRRVRFTAGENFKIEWGADHTLRDLLGFTADLDGATAYTASDVSPLLWSPAKPLTSELAPRGVLGARRPLTYFSQSPFSGSAFVVSHGVRVENRFSAGHVATSRVQTALAKGGEWGTFFETVMARGCLFRVHLDVVESEGSTAIASIPEELALAPYVFTPGGRAPTWEYRRSRGLEWTDLCGDVSFSCRDAPEYEF